MKIDTLVSIIMPVYNGEAYIQVAVQSVLDQTYENWELIIVDDGSTDGTAKFLDSLTDFRIKRINQPNRGVSAARNAALSIVQGEFITLLDADDKLPPLSITLRTKFLLKNPEVDIVDGVIHFLDKDLRNEFRRHIPSFRGLLFKRLLRLDDKVFALATYMFRTSLLKHFRFDETMTHSEDLMFFISLSSIQSIQIGYVNDSVYLYRKGHISAMSNMDGFERGYFNLLKKVKSIHNVKLSDHYFLRFKIAKILFLSWFAIRMPGRAFNSVWTVLSGVGL
ncbi:MAG: glycosyltransferase family 2 protein [Glaciimonas sp.]|nr:glycosyltransferase family 2 protein [Glaciimonas sp.]